MRIFAPKVSKLTFAAGASPADSSFTGSFTGSLVGSLTAQEDIYTTAQAGFTGLQTSISGSFAGSGSAHTQREALVSTLSGSAHTDRIAKDTTLSGSAHTDRVAKVGVLSGSAHTQREAVVSTLSGSAHTDRVAKVGALSSSLDTRIKVNETFKTNFDTAISLSSDDVTIQGDLTVQGTRTELNTATLEVQDLNITVAAGAANAAAANGAGLTVAGGIATLTYASSGDKWVFDKVVDVPTSGLLINGTAVTSTGAELNQLDDNTVGGTTAGDIVTIDGSQTLSNKTIAASQVTEISNLTADEGAQLENIGTTTISATQWGYLGASNQGITTTSDVQFDSFGVGTAASGTTGEIRATGDITAYYSSDERLKENFAPLTGALDKVKAIGGYEFDWKDGIEDVVSKTGHDIGVKAQELQAQYPELVHERDNGYLAVDYIKLNAVLIEAVKELSAKVDELSK